jgi:alanine transaminase
MSKTPTLDVSNINPNVVAAEYAVRGAIAVKAQQYGEKLRNGEDLGFESLVQCNIGALVSTSTQACATL